VLPLRWLVNHVVGSSEPLMLLCQLLSIYLFKKERYWLAGIAGAAALFVRPPGIFLWLGYLLLLAWELWQKIQSEKNFKLSYVNWKAFWAVSLIPLALVGTFGIFAWRYGDFLAYFHIGEDVKHIGPIPLSNLGAGAESGPGIFYYYIFEVVGLILLWRRKQYDIFWFGLAAFAYTLFMLYSDVLRYSIPAFPLVLAIPYAGVLTSKAARWLAVPILIAVYLYSWGVLNINLAKLDTWLEIRNILH